MTGPAITATTRAPRQLVVEGSRGKPYSPPGRTASPIDLRTAKGHPPGRFDAKPSPATPVGTRLPGRAQRSKKLPRAVGTRPGRPPTAKSGSVQRSGLTSASRRKGAIPPGPTLRTGSEEPAKPRAADPHIKGCAPASARRPACQAAALRGVVKAPAADDNASEITVSMPPDPRKRTGHGVLSCSRFSPRQSRRFEGLPEASYNDHSLVSSSC